MKKTFPRRDNARRAPPAPQRLDRRTVVIDRARHEIGGEARVVEAVKIALVDLNAHREVEVSYALRLEGFIGAAFAKKHEVVKALKDGDLESFLRDLAPIPEPAAPATPPGADTARGGGPIEETLGDTMERLVAESDAILAEDEATRTDAVPPAA